MTINRIQTSNIPLLDELIYYLKKEMISTILKDEDEANRYETLTSLKAADTYLACVEGRPRPEIFNFEKSFYYQYLSDFPYDIITQYLTKPDSLSSATYNAILTKLSNYIIDNYNEQNNYYRRLNGLPDIGDSYIYLTEDLIPRELVGVDITIPVHQFSTSVADILYQVGVINKLKALYPTKYYLDFLGSRSISIHTARTSPNFSLLYVSSDVPDIVYSLFRDKIELNRNFVIKTVYSEAYKFQSDYYSNFIRVFILVQTYVDILADMPGMIIRREIFDRRMIKLLFESNGIDYFPEIPLKYQIIMLRNLNRLLEFKSTNKNIIDICSLFGFDNIIIFKYYLLKERAIDPVTGKYIYSEKLVPDPKDLNNKISVEDLETDYNLKFVKVPIEGILDDYRNDNTKVKSYDDVVLNDIYWQGDRTYEEVKSDILNLEFNHYQSKYISVNTLYNMSEMSFELTYFFNMLFDNVDLEEMLTLDIPSISGDAFRFKFVDIICYLISIGCLYQDMSDPIMDTRSKILKVKGFNFKADLAEISSYLLQKGQWTTTLKDLGIDNFQQPKTNVLTYTQLMDIFTTNKNIYDHVASEMVNADNYRIYSIYKKIYDTLMIEDLTFDFFKNPDGSVAKTFKEFLSHRDVVLYNSIVELELIVDKEVRNERISDIIDNCVYVIECTVPCSEYKYIFSHIPTVSAESIKQYIFKVINFFKSYKVQIESINTIYVFDDKLENKIKMIDDAIINIHLTNTDVIHYISKVINTITTNPKDKISILDKAYIDINHFAEKYFYDNLELKEELLKLITLLKSDEITIDDNVYRNSVVGYTENITIPKEEVSISETFN